jgi:hypothetical protein
MQQSSLTLSNRPTATCPADATGFDIGWEHAQHGLVPPPELLLEGTPVSQGWRAARAVLGRRSPSSTRALRQWLALRTLAWRRGVDFDTASLDASSLARLYSTHCPVLGVGLGGPMGSDGAAVAHTLNPDVGYRQGNVVVLSNAAAQAGHGMTVADALRHGRTAAMSGQDVRGLHSLAWQRLAVLLSFAMPLPFHEAARMPLLVVPPVGVRPHHAVQQLQAMLSLQFLRPGWSRRTRELAAGLRREAQRTDFHLFVSALASRVVEAGQKSGPDAGPVATEHTLEDAWMHERVQQRWHRLAMGLGESGCAALLQHAVAAAPCRGPAQKPSAQGPQRSTGRPGLELVVAPVSGPNTAEADTATIATSPSRARATARRVPPALMTQGVPPGARVGPMSTPT